MWPGGTQTYIINHRVNWCMHAKFHVLRYLFSGGGGGDNRKIYLSSKTNILRKYSLAASAKRQALVEGLELRKGQGHTKGDEAEIVEAEGEDIKTWAGIVKADVTKWLENEDIRASHQHLTTSATMD